MKSAFAAMLRAGITRAIFSARCDFLDLLQQLPEGYYVPIEEARP